MSLYNKEEIWRDIDGYKGLYQVSNYGQVKSLARIIKRSNGRNLPLKEKILVPFNNGSNYLQVKLYKEGEITAPYIHDLVAKAFIPIPDHLKQLIGRCYSSGRPMLEVNHMDENRENNCAENLEWCDSLYNNNYGNRNCRIRNSNTNGKCAKKVLQYSNDWQLINIYPSAMEIERQTGYKNSNIIACCKGRIENAYGYIWRHE